MRVGKTKLKLRSGGARDGLGHRHIAASVATPRATLSRGRVPVDVEIRVLEASPCTTVERIIKVGGLIPFVEFEPQLCSEHHVAADGRKVEDGRVECERAARSTEGTRQGRPPRGRSGVDDGVVGWRALEQVRAAIKTGRRERVRIPVSQTVGVGARGIKVLGVRQSRNEGVGHPGDGERHTAVADKVHLVVTDDKDVELAELGLERVEDGGARAHAVEGLDRAADVVSLHHLEVAANLASRLHGRDVERELQHERRLGDDAARAVDRDDGREAEVHGLVVDGVRRRQVRVGGRQIRELHREAARVGDVDDGRAAVVYTRVNTHDLWAVRDGHDTSLGLGRERKSAGLRQAKVDLDALLVAGRRRNAADGREDDRRFEHHNVDGRWKRISLARLEHCSDDANARLVILRQRARAGTTRGTGHKQGLA